MTEKVKISREQEKILEERILYYGQKGFNKNQIVSALFDDKKRKGAFEGTPFQYTGMFDFMKIITCQYEVEQTPEEEIAEFYQRHQKQWIDQGDVQSSGIAQGVSYVVNKMSLKIKGVNA